MPLSTIGSNQITDGAIAVADVADGSITTAKIADDAVTTAKITDANITTAKIADDAVTGTKLPTNVDLVDNQKIRFGTGNDLAIYHEPTFNNSIIQETGAGNLLLGGDQIDFRNSGLTVVRANFSTAVKLNYNGSTKLETSVDGVKITGGIDFSANANASGMTSELLDDYEEGTWTPATSSSSYNTGSSTGLYTKIGRIVIAHFSINFSGVNSSSNSICTITNFPFTNGGAIASAGTVRESSNTGAVYTTRIGTNTTTATMNSMDNVTNGSQRTIRTGEDYVGTLIYVT